MRNIAQELSMMFLATHSLLITFCRTFISSLFYIKRKIEKLVFNHICMFQEILTMHLNKTFSHRIRMLNEVDIFGAGVLWWLYLTYFWSLHVLHQTCLNGASYNTFQIQRVILIILKFGPVQDFRSTQFEFCSWSLL